MMALGGSLASATSIDACQSPDHFVATILTTCCVGVRDVRTSSPSLFFDVLDELLDDAEMYVGLEQRHADSRARLPCLQPLVSFARRS